MNAAGGVPLKSDVSRKDTTSSLQEHHKSQVIYVWLQSAVFQIKERLN